METKIGPKILTFYSNSLPLIFFLVFQGFDWRSGSVDPNPWSWMSGSIREGIGKDGCSERDQFFFLPRIQMRFEFRTNYRKSQSNIFSPLFIRRPYLFKFFFSGNGFYFTRNRNRGPGSWIKGWIRRCLVIKIGVFGEMSFVWEYYVFCSA